MANSNSQDEENAVALPATERIELGVGVSLQPPLSRRGHGPGLIVVVPEGSLQQHITSDLLPPLQKWAEEGFAVVEIQADALDIEEDAGKVLGRAIAGLEQCSSCEGDKVALVVYQSMLLNKIEPALPSNSNIVAVVVYGSSHILTPTLKTTSTVPYAYHLAGTTGIKSKPTDIVSVYEYPKASSPLFAFPGHDGFHPTSESVSHSRNLTFLKKHVGAPSFDLEAIWEEHTHYEFGDRSVAKTMGTMVQEPYMTGGIGRERLSNFYRHHFIFNNPADTELELVSRTVGIDRIVDEFVFSFTHNMQIDWLVPGIPPTGRHVRIPFTSVVNVRGDRLYHEHIAWDQASVLVQLGLMPEYLPFPYTLPDGTKPGPGKMFQYRVPAAGVDTARKILDKNSVPSNDMFNFEVREVDDKFSS
ncbi:NTF2-like protein [Venustampulla echinocandica]|uniref:NTF2-like protein n=1 Tax=Venustampulla echinocandica TaxID=2656787 RepID=A0A370TLP5_9HELO|nr:NTF2-like protein [Venustampulla echinocandica]RDL36456.1 NTF2-like protein [Venustampulla echinocandica]